MDEALKLSDRLVVMSYGNIEQIATPEEILKNPANSFVRDLIGKERLIQARPNIITVGQIMSKKPVTLTKNETMHSALKLMHDERVDTLLVTDDEKHLLGFIDVEDINDHYSPNKKIKDLINADIFICK